MNCNKRTKIKLLVVHGKVNYNRALYLNATQTEPIHTYVTFIYIWYHMLLSFYCVI